ncbi:MAG: MnhB domain-containing protein [Phycisphaeraceae bacterium]
MNSILLHTALKLIVPLGLLFGLFMAIKGHNEPGGGFIGGLIASVSLVIYRLSAGGDAFARLVPAHPRAIVMTGLLLALGVGVAPMLVGWPFLTSYHGYLALPGEARVHLTTVLIFDAGVLLVVIGSATGMILRLGEELDRA